MICESLVAVSISLASVHFVGGNWNEVNPGVHVECGAYQSGIFLNSYKRTSLYVGRKFEYETMYGTFGGLIGPATGYPSPIMGVLYYTLPEAPIRLYTIPGYCIGLTFRTTVKGLQ